MTNTLKLTQIRNFNYELEHTFQLVLHTAVASRPLTPAVTDNMVLTDLVQLRTRFTTGKAKILPK